MRASVEPRNEEDMSNGPCLISAMTPNLDLALDGVKDAVRLLDLDRAIESLACDSPLPAQVIEMRYFGGMTAEETADAAYHAGPRSPPRTAFRPCLATPQTGGAGVSIDYCGSSSLSVNCRRTKEFPGSLPSHARHNSNRRLATLLASSACPCWR